MPVLTDPDFSTLELQEAARDVLEELAGDSRGQAVRERLKRAVEYLYGNRCNACGRPRYRPAQRFYLVEDVERVAQHGSWRGGTDRLRRLILEHFVEYGEVPVLLSGSVVACILAGRTARR